VQQARHHEHASQACRYRQIDLRVGIYIGVVIEGDDLLGDGVNVVAQLEGIAKPGDICISEDAYRLVQGKVSAEFLDIGEQRHKNIARPGGSSGLGLASSPWGVAFSRHSILGHWCKGSLRPNCACSYVVTATTVAVKNARPGGAPHRCFARSILKPPAVGGIVKQLQVETFAAKLNFENLLQSLGSTPHRISHVRDGIGFYDSVDRRAEITRPTTTAVMAVRFLPPRVLKSSSISVASSVAGIAAATPTRWNSRA
jgi:hypothetical protein